MIFHRSFLLLQKNYAFDLRTNSQLGGKVLYLLIMRFLQHDKEYYFAFAYFRCATANAAICMLFPSVSSINSIQITSFFWWFLLCRQTQTKWIIFILIRTIKLWWLHSTVGTLPTISCLQPYVYCKTKYKTRPAFMYVLTELQVTNWHHFSSAMKWLQGIAHIAWNLDGNIHVNWDIDLNTMLMLWLHTRQ